MSMTVVAIILCLYQVYHGQADAENKWLCKIVRLSQWDFYSNVFVCCNKASQFDWVAGSKKKPKIVIGSPLAAINDK